MSQNQMTVEICLTGNGWREQYPPQLFETFGFGESQMGRVAENDMNGGLGRTAVEELDLMRGEQHGELLKQSGPRIGVSFFSDPPETVLMVTYNQGGSAVIAIPSRHFLVEIQRRQQ